MPNLFVHTSFPGFGLHGVDVRTGQNVESLFSSVRSPEGLEAVRATNRMSRWDCLTLKPIAWRLKAREREIRKVGPALNRA